MASFLPPIGRSSQPYGQLPLPPGSALRFSADDLSADEQRLSNSNALMQNLETEMGRLLEWAGAGGGEAAARRDGRGPDEPGSAAQRRQDLHAYLDARADVHQKRAKRRELTEPTGVRLPRQGRPRGRAQREVSYLSDRPRRENPANVPESMIPDAFRVLLEAPLPYAEPGFLGAFGGTDEWRHNLATRKWERTVFPSKVPAGRRDVQLLHAWVGDMVARLQQTAGKLPEENMLKEAQVLFSVAFHEMIRQVSVHCLERGHLMGKIWWSEMELFQRLLQLRQADAQLVRREREEHRAELDGLRRQVRQMQARVARPDRRHSQPACTPTDSLPRGSQAKLDDYGL